MELGVNRLGAAVEVKISVLLWSWICSGEVRHTPSRLMVRGEMYVSLTIQSFTITEVFVCIPLADGNYEREFRGFAVWLGDKFIGDASSYPEAVKIAKEYMANMDAKVSRARTESWSPSP